MAELAASSTDMYMLIDGFRWPCFFDPEAFQSIKKHVPQDNDAFIVTYPKCGTTWMAQIVYLIKNKGVAPTESLIYSLPFLDLMGTEFLDTLPKPTVSRIHLPYNLAPISDKAKYIYVTRNPKDCAVSFYHFVGGDMEFNDFFDMFHSGNILYGDFFDSVLSWYAHRNDPNVLFLTYESMKKDIRGTIIKIAHHLGEEHYKTVSDEAVMLKIIEYSSFEYMKKTVDFNISFIYQSYYDGYGGDMGKWPVTKAMKFALNLYYKTKSKSLEGTIVRKGLVGDWKGHLSADQNKLLNEKIQERLKGTEILKEWTDFGCL